MAKKLTTEEFIKRAKEVHGDKYDYSKTDLDNRDEKGRVIIICPIHGEFWQKVYNHLNHYGCKECSYNNMRNGVDKFIKQAKEIHGDKYDYSKVEYINNKTKVCIICPIHGEFWQKPNNHLQGQGCFECNGSIKYTTETFIKKAKEVHGDKYDYSKVEYIKSHIDIIITCPIHGDFLVKPYSHLQGVGCSKCYGNKRLSKEEFIKHAKEIHGDKYDYSKVEYVNNRTKVCIICPIHGEFWQTPDMHISIKMYGCPICGKSQYIKEQTLRNVLIKTFNDIEYQKKFEWLGLQLLDFYLPKYNIGIELQGIQHFKPIKYFGGDEKYNKTIERDWRKIKLCEQNGVKLLHFAFLKEKDFENCGYEVINDVDKLISIIKESVE